MTVHRRLAYFAAAVIVGLALNQGAFQWSSSARRAAQTEVDASRTGLSVATDLQRKLQEAATDLDLASRPGAVALTGDALARRNAAVATDLSRVASRSGAPDGLAATTADEVRQLFAEWDAYAEEAATAMAPATEHLARARRAARRLAYDLGPRLQRDAEAAHLAAQGALAGVERRIAAITWTFFALSLVGVVATTLWLARSTSAPASAQTHAVETEARADLEVSVLPTLRPTAPPARLDDRAPDHKMQAIGRLAGGVAHDFNNLLTIIKGHTERLLEAAGTQPARIRLEEVQRAADRAAALTSQLLAFSRRQVMAPRIISLNYVVSDLQSLLRPLLGDRIALDLELDRALWPVRADPGQLAQVVMNLVVNARDAMPEGGTVVIRTANIAPGDPRVTRSTLAASSLVALSVRDTGVGMDDATLSHIFEPFFTTKGVGQGTGMGLSTAHGIVGQSGGEIVVASAPGKGTTFTIMLPRAAEDAVAELASEDDRPGHTDRIPGIQPW